MCELMFVHAKGTDLNRIISLQLSKFDSEFSNKDGYGIFTKTGVWKTVTAASELQNIGIILRERIKNPGPVLLHVRAASKGIAVKEDNVHPFETKDFVLAHNGTLFQKDESTTWEDVNVESKPSDSLMFLNELQKQYLKKKEVVESLQAAMENFKGKFAFLIYCKKENQYYAVRGKTADLHIAYLKSVSPEGEVVPIGYVINTVKLHLEKALEVTCDIYELSSGRPLFYEIKELPEETIFKCNEDNVYIIGKLEEVNAYAATNFPREVAKLGITHTSMKTRPFLLSSPVTLTSEGEEQDEFVQNSQAGMYTRRIKEICQLNLLDLGNVETIVTVVLGISIADLEEEDLEILALEVFPLLIPQKDVMKYIKENRSAISPLEMSFFEDAKFQWPLGSNRNTKAATVVNQLKRYYSKKGKEA